MSGRDRERILSQSAPDSIKKRALSFPRPIETKMESVPQEKLKELLDLNSSIFSDMKDLGVTLYRVSESAKSFLNVERCTIWLKREGCNDLYAKVFNGKITAHPDEQDDVPVVKEGHGICQHVLSSGSLHVTTNAQFEPMFNKEIDANTGFHTQSMISVPIFSGKKEAIGVFQLVNKTANGDFTELDKTLAVLFSSYAGIGIGNAILYDKAKKAKAQAKVAMSILMYQWHVDDDVVHAMIKNLRSKSLPQGVERLEFSVREMPISELSSFVFLMYEDCGMLSYLRCSREALARYILLAEKGYRVDVPYHNWQHAVSVVHAAYAFEKEFHLSKEYLPRSQVLIWLLAMLTHDVDHRGTNNAHQTVVSSELAALYSSEGSILERHHLSQTMCLLSTPGCEILNSLSSKDYSGAIELIKFIILQTDLSRYFAQKDGISQIDKYDKTSRKHQEALLGLLVTAADLNEAFKEFESAKKVALLIYEEFFRQGDLERGFGHNPAPSMDRNLVCIEEAQVGFLSSVALPLAKTLARLVPEAKQAQENCEKLLETWKKQQKKENETSL